MREVATLFVVERLEPRLLPALGDDFQASGFELIGWLCQIALVATEKAFKALRALL